jgi:Ketosteroid isomerase-related protein
MNTEIIQKIYSAFKAKDLPGVLQLQSENAVWSVAGPANKIPWAGPEYGHEGVSNFLKVLAQWLVPEVFEINDYFEKHDKVVAIGFQKGYVRSTNVPFEFEFVHVWELKNGKVEKFRVYYDTDYVAGILSKRS